MTGVQTCALPICGAAFTSAGVAVAALVPCAWAKPGDNASAPTPARAVIRKDIDEFIMPLPNFYSLDLIVLSKACLPSAGRYQDGQIELLGSFHALLLSLREAS